MCCKEDVDITAEHTSFRRSDPVEGSAVQLEFDESELEPRAPATTDAQNDEEVLADGHISRC
jgi:hypothetical protein